MEILENFNNEPVDILLIETMGNLLEIKSILKLTNQINKKVWLRRCFKK
jgi:Homocysteine/selenocysteine methylase (S-methylmethionine-dependent)